MPTLAPLGGSSAARSFAYWGERADWLVALSQHRDSDALNLIERDGDPTYGRWHVGTAEDCDLGTLRDSLAADVARRLAAG